MRVFRRLVSLFSQSTEVRLTICWNRQGLPAVATATTTVGAPVAATAASVAALFARLGFAYLDGTAFNGCTVEFLDGLLGSCVVGHFNESEATATVREFVHDNFGGRNFAILSEKFAEVLILHVEAEVRNVNVHLKYEKWFKCLRQTQAD